MSKIELEIQFPCRKMWDCVALLCTVEIGASHASYLDFLYLVSQLFSPAGFKEPGRGAWMPLIIFNSSERQVKLLSQGFQQAKQMCSTSSRTFLMVDSSVCVCTAHRAPPPLLQIPQGKAQQGLSGICALAKFQLFHAPRKKGWEERREGKQSWLNSHWAPNNQWS